MLNKINLKINKTQFSLHLAFLFFLLGALLTLAFSPFDLFYLPLFLMMAVFYCCLKCPPHLTAKYLFIFGLGHYLTGTYWIYISVHIFGNAPLWIAITLMICLVLLMSSYFAIAGWLISWFSYKNKFPIIFSGPSIWVLIEWLKGWLFSGFPWLSLGYSQIDTGLSGWAPLLGVYGVSWWLLFGVAGCLYYLIKRKLTTGLLFIITPFIFGYGLSGYNWTEEYGKPIETVIIQGGVSQDLKWKAEQFPKTLDLYLQATIDAPQGSFIVWPEVAIPASSDQIRSYLQLIETHLKESKKKLALGILEKNTHTKTHHNSVLFIDGVGQQYYRKRHLVPFGEYFPIPGFMREWLRLLSLPNTDLVSGEQIQPLITFDNNVSLAVAICYEIAFGAQQLYAFPEAGLLINVSNDAWFGDSIAPHQHLQLSRMRSLEVGREMVRVTNDGISAFIDSKGKVVKQSDQFVFYKLATFAQPRKGATPYVLFGNWPILILNSLLLIVFFKRKILRNEKL